MPPFIFKSKPKKMKNTSALLFILFIAFSGFSQRKNTKELDEFTQVKVYDRIEVTLVKSNENKLVITGDDQDEVRISNKKGLLKIRMEFDNFLQGHEAKATLYYTEELTLIDANENAKIKSKNTLSGSHMEIKAQEGGKVSLKVAMTDVFVKAVTGGEISLDGKAKSQEVMVNTGGEIYNKSLHTKETTIVVNAGGRAEIKATEKVVAKVRAGGSIFIYGNPKDVQRDKVFGGKIKLMD